MAAVIGVTLTVKTTGTRIEDTEIHLWTFGAHGKIIALRHFVDTLPARRGARRLIGGV
ncbi:MAG: hypothetical protein ACXWFN_11140 [Solirubrobacterales bacterium]